MSMIYSLLTWRILSIRNVAEYWPWLARDLDTRLASATRCERARDSSRLGQGGRARWRLAQVRTNTRRLSLISHGLPSPGTREIIGEICKLENYQFLK